MSLISKSPAIAQPKIGMNGGLSKPQNTAVGSGCRPTPSKIKLPSSAPVEPRYLGRKTPGSL